MEQTQEQDLVTVAVRMPKCVRDDLARVAKANDRTVPSELRRLIARHLAPDVAAAGDRQ